MYEGGTRRIAFGRPRYTVSIACMGFLLFAPALARSRPFLDFWATSIDFYSGANQILYNSLQPDIEIATIE
jgi:hypothetical protein